MQGDRIVANFRDIEVLDKIPTHQCKNITKLFLSHNAIRSLQGIEQFKHLTHLSLSYNKIESLEEFTRIRFPDKILAISIKGNPIALHPNIAVSLVEIFPRLIELDGVKIDEHLKQDIEDSLRLRNVILQYIIRTELELARVDADIKRAKLKQGLVASGKVQLSLDDLAEFASLQKLQLANIRPVPKFPIYPYQKQIRPGFVLSAIETVLSQFEYRTENEAMTIGEIYNIYRWVFCELLSKLDKWGNNDLQQFLCLKAGLPDWERIEPLIAAFEELDHELDYDQISRTLAMSTASNRLSQRDIKGITLTKFPVFAGNSDYNKALLEIITDQMQTLQILENERVNALSVDLGTWVRGGSPTRPLRLSQLEEVEREKTDRTVSEDRTERSPLKRYPSEEKADDQALRTSRRFASPSELARSTSPIDTCRTGRSSRSASPLWGNILESEDLELSIINESQTDMPLSERVRKSLQSPGILKFKAISPAPDLKKGMKDDEIDLTFRGGIYGKDEKDLLQFYKKFYNKQVYGEKCRDIFQNWRKLANKNKQTGSSKKLKQVKGMIRVLNFSHQVIKHKALKIWQKLNQSYRATTPVNGEASFSQMATTKDIYTTRTRSGFSTRSYKTDRRSTRSGRRISKRRRRELDVTRVLKNISNGKAHLSTLYKDLGTKSPCLKENIQPCQPYVPKVKVSKHKKGHKWATCKSQRHKEMKNQLIALKRIVALSNNL